jgi:hypothetical protein
VVFQPASHVTLIVSTDQTDVYIHTTSPVVVSLPLAQLTRDSIRFYSTQLPNVGCVVQHRHGWLAVVSMDGTLQLLDASWQPLRMGSSDGEPCNTVEGCSDLLCSIDTMFPTDMGCSQHVLRLADCGIAGSDVATVTWLDTVQRGLSTAHIYDCSHMFVAWQYTVPTAVVNAHARPTLYHPAPWLEQDN